MEELNGSELGTLEYWKEIYRKEIKNFDNHGDVGDVWFGEDSVNRIMKWIEKENINKDSKIIDIGCGNGYSLIELANEGFTNLTGIDYSPEAIELAMKVTKDKYKHIKFKVFDLLSGDVSDLGAVPYDVAHDKGTYDAISLNPDSPGDKRRIYIDKIHQLLSSQGLLIITSCNWTEDELVDHMKDLFVLKYSIPTFKYIYGGKTGNITTSLVFTKC